MAHSQLGAVDVYNMLPEYVAAAEDVTTFQNRLQQILKLAAMEGVLGWENLLSNRHLMYQHPLRGFYGFEGLGAGTNGCILPALVETPMDHCIDGWLSFGQ